MELSTLQAFVEVADRASFSAAAEALFLTQPAVSKRVAQLETELDVKLFDRIGRQVALSNAGSVLLPRARRLLNDARELRRLVSDLSGEVRGRLVMGTSHHIGLHRLPAPLKHFSQCYPEVQLDLRFMDSEAACHAVEVGDLELAIVTLPPQQPPNLQMRPIWDDPLAFMLGRDHPLADRREVRLNELLEYPAVLPGSTTYTRGILEEAVRGLGVQLNVAMTTNYLETLHMLVATGLGWSLLPATQLNGDVHPLTVTGMQLTRQLGAVTHQKRSLSNAATEMIRICSQI